MPAPDTGFTVTYTLNKFRPATVPVNVIRNPGDYADPASTTADPLTSRSAAFTFADCGVIPSCLDCGKISEQRHLRPQGLLA